MPTSTTSKQESRRTVREVVGLLPDAEALNAAVSELLVSEFDRRDLSVLSANGESPPEPPGGIADLEDDPGAPRGVYVSRASLGDAEGAVIGGAAYAGATAAAGAAAATSAGSDTILTATVASGGLGGLLGWAGARWLDRRYAARFREQIRSGGLVLWIRAEDAKHEQIAFDVLKRHSARDTHVHELPA